MLADGKRVDLYKLFKVVKGKGGYDAVCDSNLWDLVAEETGLGLSVGSAVELVYSQYLSGLDSWLKKKAADGGKMPAELGGLVDDRVMFSRRLRELHDEVAGFLEYFVAAEDNEAGGKEFKGEARGGGDGVEGVSLEMGGDKGVESGGHRDVEMEDCTGNESVLGKFSGGDGDGMQVSAEAAVGVSEEFGGGKVPADAKVDVSDEVNKTPGVSDGSDKEGSSRKRKRDSIMNVLSWVTGVAVNPCDPEVGLMPEKSKWKSHGSEAVWKQVLLLREASSFKRSFESSSEQHYWQSQKMHPSLYEDHQHHPGATYNLRERLKDDKSLSPGKSTPAVRRSSESPAAGEGDSDGCGMVDVPLGRSYQAAVPEWTGEASESDSKWLGTKTWPLTNVNPRLLIERDPIGKGRQDSCGCAVPGSVECVRFHISEKRAKVKLELGKAFDEMSLDMSGEEVKCSWTEEEEKRFKDVVQSHRKSNCKPSDGSSESKCKPSDESADEADESPDGYFWDHIFESFPTKSREDLVSYYYNVFLLERRGYQNRFAPDKIDSDDDDSELRNVFGNQNQKSGQQTQKETEKKKSKSVLLTPKKPQKKRR